MMGHAMTDASPALLPSGLVDLLPPEARAEAEAITALMTCFYAHGYQRIKPPLIEFEDSLLAPGPGYALAHNTFRLMDPVSQRMMGLRSDTTPQISRIAASRLGKVARPLRLTYATDVLRVAAGQARTERQFIQAGCELIGSAGPQADIEVAVLALRALAALGIDGLSIDLATPTLVPRLYQALEINMNVRKALDAALHRRDAGAIDELGDAAEIFASLLACTGPAEDVMGSLLALDLPEAARAEVTTLSAVCNGVKAALDALGLRHIAVTIDPVERRGFEYHTGIGFTVFAGGAKGELGRGGRYDAAFGHGTGMARIETATGFTLYMDTLRRVLPPAPAQKILGVPASESWDTVKKFQEDGWTVVRMLEGAETAPGCTHISVNGTIESAKAG